MRFVLQNLIAKYSKSLNSELCRRCFLNKGAMRRLECEKSKVHSFTVKCKTNSFESDSHETAYLFKFSVSSEKKFWVRRENIRKKTLNLRSALKIILIINNKTFNGVKLFSVTRCANAVFKWPDKSVTITSKDKHGCT